MSPEQIEGGDVSAASDVFGLGVLLYEAMVGKLPFEGKNPAQVLRRVLDGSFTSPDRARPTIGSNFGAIVAKALAHEPRDRYQSAAALAEALRAELKSLGFEDPRRDLYEFLRDASLYQQSYETRLVQRLIARAQAARQSKDVPLAAASFNRALAFHPDDAELLSQVANLARGQRLRRTLLRAGGGVFASAVVVGLVFAAVRALDRDDEAPAIKTNPTAVAPRSSAVARPNPAGSVAPQASTEGAASPASRKPAPRGRTPVPAVVVPAAPELASVRILVDGPRNATVRVDGAEVRWFGPPIDLTVGPHTFEFLPPNEECCEGGQAQTVTIGRPTTPGEVQTVRGHIQFREATLDLRGASGSSASCGELGSFPVPSQQRIKMVAASVRAHCVIFPPASSAEPPKEFDVALSPGRVSNIPGP